MVVNPEVAALQAQIEALRHQATAPSAQQSPQNAIGGISLDDIKSVVKGMLEEFAATSGTIQKIEPIKKYTLLEAIGLALTNDEQIWLSTPVVLNDLPNFIASENGQTLIKNIVSNFREYYENKECS